MPTHRTLPTIVLIAIAAMGLAACAAINEVVTDRNLICEDTPEDLCIRVADLVSSTLPDELRTTISEVRVEPRTCDVEEAGDIRCWSVESDFPGGTAASWAHQHSDGTLGMHYTSKGAPPDT